MARHTSVEYIRFTTDGNAARKVEVAEPIKTMRLPRVKKQKSITWRIDPLALTAIAMTLVMALCMVVGVLQLDAVRQENAAMQAHVENLQQQNEELQTYFEENCDMDRIERTAMALGMVPKDQVICIRIQVPQEIVEEQPGAWERFTTFLSGLFA